MLLEAQTLTALTKKGKEKRIQIRSNGGGVTVRSYLPRSLGLRGPSHLSLFTSTLIHLSFNLSIYLIYPCITRSILIVL